MLNKIMALGGILSLMACSSIDNSTYKAGDPGVTDEMVEQQKAEDLPFENVAFVVAMILALGTLINDHSGGISNGPPLPP